MQLCLLIVVGVPVASGAEPKLTPIAAHYQRRSGAIDPYSPGRFRSVRSGGGEGGGPVARFSFSDRSVWAF
jgi:hypothetical protein